MSDLKSGKRLRRGSALLIVLGLMAFMIVSAVTFSVYLRNARLPSSFLHRTSYSRLLVKAALAEAIDIIDQAIGDNPHPGLGTEHGRFGSDHNYWMHRVFIGQNKLVDVAETVSTLTLESLAYLPPALVNEVRYYAPRSQAACWQNLSFDAGRFAFTAVDVSDYFDINRIVANVGRSSAETGRLSLAYLFENEGHTSYQTNPQEWDTFMDNFIDATKAAEHGGSPASANPGKVPLVSLADFNLALNDLKKNWVDDKNRSMSPFCRYLNSEGKTDFVATETEAKNGLMRRLTFVTGGFFPSTNDATSAQYNLCNSQPFPVMEHSPSAQKSYAEQMDGEMSSPILTKLTDRVTELDTVSLYDYLDENDIPTSLALPSVEAVPMICAIRPLFQFDLKPKADALVYKPESGLTTPPTALTDVLYETHTYRLELDNPGGEISLACLFPFRHCGNESVSFTVDFAVRIGLTLKDGPGFRQAGGGFVIENAGAGNGGFKTPVEVKDGIIRLYKTAERELKFDLQEIETPAQAYQTVSVTFDSALQEVQEKFAAADGWLFKVTYEIRAIKDPDDKDKFVWDVENKKVVPSGPDQPAINTAFFGPLTEDGRLDQDKTKFTVDYLINQGKDCEVRPSLTFTARVVSRQSNKTVDLVPATILDDKIFNDLSTLDEVKIVGGSGHSLFTLTGENTLTFSEEFFQKENDKVVSESFSPTKNGGLFVCPDPRWNFAPQNFYVKNGSSLPSADEFVAACKLGAGGRDRDIFLSVSNQGYLQSPSELAFLPRTTKSRLPVAGSQFGDCKRADTPPAQLAQEADNGAPYENLGHGELMWKTYRLYPSVVGGEDDDRLYELGLFVDGTGPCVNPLAADRQTLIAALANTPYSWWAASTNQADGAFASPNKSPVEDFNKNYAFNGFNARAKFAWEDLEAVAEKLNAGLRANAANWENFYLRGFDWAGASQDSNFCGIQFSNDTDPTSLKDVDRKMLCGFWRDSLAVKQQLFLVFVRAEPTINGAGSVRQTPPQLGARAMALVWRDPLTRKSADRPHQTRVLFYRQFE